MGKRTTHNEEESVFVLNNSCAQEWVRNQFKNLTFFYFFRMTLKGALEITITWKLQNLSDTVH